LLCNRKVFAVSGGFFKKEPELKSINLRKKYKIIGVL